MKVIAKVIDVESVRKSPKGKQMCGVSLKSGDTLFSVTVFENSIKDGTLDKIRAVQGKEIETDINIDMYNGRVSYMLGYGAEFIEQTAPNKTQPKLQATG
jgi:hypothetical protein